LETNKTAYIAIGSNQGQKLQHLQDAIDMIYSEVGDVVRVSKIYKTPAWGFNGNEFLNACIEVITRLTAEDLLRSLLEIELKLGRERIPNQYTNRTIDLDIIFYDRLKLEQEHLVIPHPKLTSRKFVLQPLADLIPDFIHPDFKTSISDLLANTADNSTIEVVTEQLQPKFNQLEKLSFLAIEGNIGSGKTSLSQMISEDFNAKLILERFKDNAFLPKFYEDQKRYAFPLEMSFLADRHQQIADDIAQFDLFTDFVVSDYDVHKSLIFAKVTLEAEEFSLYKKIFNVMYSEIPKPDLYVYLYQSTEQLLENIKKRGRDYEQNIAPDYLEQINTGYLEFIKHQQQLNIKLIDMASIDFVNSRIDYNQLIKTINHSISHLNLNV
jgi:2-amino-4-hydroxy-6-hydroxymethyldihydropteridine diphosphokinase